jgi:hypothetical protein
MYNYTYNCFQWRYNDGDDPVTLASGPNLLRECANVEEDGYF